MDVRTEKQLAERVAHLERRMVELEARAATEVRTGRVVVVDDHGFERIILAGGPDGASVTVRAYVPEGTGTTGVELYAFDDPDEVEPGAGVCFIHKGDMGSRWQIG